MKSHIDDNKKKRIKETAYGIWYVISCIALALLVALYVGVLFQTIKRLLTKTKLKARSILYIALFQMINLSIVLLLPGKGVLNTLTNTFYTYPENVITAVKGFFTGIAHFLH